MLMEFLLAVAVSVDIFLTAMTYGNSGIEIPRLCGLVISLTGAVLLGASLGLSELVSAVLPLGLCETAGMIILIAMGVITIFKSFIRMVMRKITDSNEKALHLSGFGLGVSIYLDERYADIDGSDSLSVKEALLLALASSLDSAATGLGCGFVGVSPILTTFFAFFMGFAAICTGSYAGRKIASLSRDFSWVGGVILIFCAVSARVFHSL